MKSQQEVQITNISNYDLDQLKLNPKAFILQTQNLGCEPEDVVNP